jgi:uncharacterized protein
MLRLYFFILSLTLCAQSLLALDVPTLTSPVVDLAGLLRSKEKRALEDLLFNANKQGIMQGQILIIPSLQGEVLEEYSIKVVDEWKLGSKEKDHGWLLLVALDERSVRLEVGQGLEGPIPDSIAYRQIQLLKVYFKKGEFFQGFEHVILNIEKLLTGQEIDYAREEIRPSPSAKDWRNVLPIIIFFLIFVFNFFRRTRRGLSIFTHHGGWGQNSGGSFPNFGGGWGGGGGGFSGGGSSGKW